MQGGDSSANLQVPVDDVRLVVVQLGDSLTDVTEDAQDLLLLKDTGSLRQTGCLFLQLLVHLRQN